MQVAKTEKLIFYKRFSGISALDLRDDLEQ